MQMEFTHFDEAGNARMVDVGDKDETKREAVAKGSIFMSPECLRMVAEGSHPLVPYFESHQADH